MTTGCLRTSQALNQFLRRERHTVVLSSKASFCVLSHPGQTKKKAPVVHNRAEHAEEVTLSNEEDE